MQLSTIAVLRDTSTGASFLVPCDSHEDIDLARLEETGYELSGWLQHGGQYNPKAKFSEQCTCETEDEFDDDGLTVYRGPCFTQCSLDTCNNQVAIIDGGAPEHCREHEDLDS